MLINRDGSLLLVVDMQARLLPAIAGHEAVLASVKWLVGAASRLGVATLATEQYPQGLGGTEDSLRALLGAESVSAKIRFSCGAGRCFGGDEAPRQRQVIVCGIEAHVCVLQTCADLVAHGRKVFVVADAIGSRSPNDAALAVERMRGFGVEVVSREMVAFEWLRQAGTNEFRQFSKEFLRSGV